MAKKGMAVPAGMDDYETREDVRAMARADQVLADKGRHDKAKKHAKTMGDEHAAQLAAMKKISSPMEGPTVEGAESGPPDPEDIAEAKPTKRTPILAPTLRGKK